MSAVLPTLFQYAVILDEFDDDGDLTDSTLVVELTTVLAKDDEAAAMRAARAIPTEHEDHLDDCRVVVRPF